MNQHTKEMKQKNQEFIKPIMDYLSSQNKTQKYVSTFKNMDTEVNSVDELIIKEKGILGKSVAAIKISQRTGTIDCETYDAQILPKEKLLELTPIKDIQIYYFGKN